MAEEKTQEKQENKPQTTTKSSLPKVTEFRPGDTVRVVYKIVEGDVVRRTQPFEGIVISKKGSDISKTFTVRKIGADGIGVERIFPLYSPNIESITVIKRGKVRRAKLYYLREKTGREAVRVKERKEKVSKD